MTTGDTDTVSIFQVTLWSLASIIGAVKNEIEAKEFLRDLTYCYQRTLKNEVLNFSQTFDKLRDPAVINLTGIITDTFWTSPPYHENAHYCKI